MGGYLNLRNYIEKISEENERYMLFLNNLLNIMISPFMKNFILSTQCTIIGAERNFSLPKKLLTHNKQIPHRTLNYG